MRRSTAAVALVSLLAATPACTMTRSTRRTTIGAGAVTTLAGLLVTGRAVRQGGHDFLYDNPDEFDRDLGVTLLGTAMMVTGLGLLIGGATARPPWRPDPPAEGALTMGPPSGPGMQGALPTAPTTPEVTRLAKQVRAAVQRNECEAAWRTLAIIDGHDANYASLIAAGSLMQPCPRAY